MKTNILSILLILVTSISLVNAQLIARYEFETNADDSTGINNGTLMGDAQIVSDAQRGSVLSLDGDGDYVDIADNTTFATNSITVAAWVKASGQETKSIVTHYEYGIGIDNRSWRMATGSSEGIGQDDQLHIALSDNGEYFYGHRKDYQTNTATFYNTWQHVAFTFNAPSSALKLYINGIEQTSLYKRCDDPITSLYDSTASIAIGCDFDSSIATRFLTGLVDDVQIYNYAISSAEMIDVMNGDVVPEPMTLALLGLGGLLIRRRK